MDYCQGMIDDVRITCEKCGMYHSIFMGCTLPPADIPLDQAIAEMHRIAERDRQGLIAAGVLVDESDGNKIAIR